jgi:hypothetical protein
LVIALMMAGKDGEARRLLSGISTTRERAEVQAFATAWLEQRSRTEDTTEEDM